MLNKCAGNFNDFSRIFLNALSAGLLLTLSPGALAQEDDYINPDRPGIADGSKVVGDGRFQIETGIQRELRNNDGLNERRLFLPTLLRYGVNEKWEIRVESNVYTWKRESDPLTGTRRSRGTSPVSLGAKYQFQDSKNSMQPSFGAIFRIFPASGSQEFGTKHTTGDIRLAADWDFAPDWSLNPNLGLAIYEDEQNQKFTARLFALTLNYNPTKTLNFFVDTGVQSPEKKDGSSSVIYDAGIAYLVNRDIQLDLSVGTGPVGTTPPHPFYSLGISKRF
jgi:hypothetical protein